MGWEKDCPQIGPGGAFSSRLSGISREGRHEGTKWDSGGGKSTGREWARRFAKKCQRGVNGHAGLSRPLYPFAVVYRGHRKLVGLGIDGFLLHHLTPNNSRRINRSAMRLERHYGNDHDHAMAPIRFSIRFPWDRAVARVVRLVQD